MIPTTAEVWESFSEKLLGYISRKVADPDDAEDLLQEVFVKIHMNLVNLQDDQRLAPWIYGITRNTVTDYYRTRRVGAPLSEDLAAEEPGEEEAEAQLAQGLGLMLFCLPEKYRQALLLSELQGLKQQEVAGRLGISLSGAKSRVQRGRGLLRDCLEECCQFEFDRRGRVMEYTPRIAECGDCTV